MAVATGYAPLVEDDAVTFFLPDEDAALVEVKLMQEVVRPRVGPGFTFDNATRVWNLRFPRPDADRIEYLFHLARSDGRTETIVDLSNPLRAAGPFGDKSVVEFSGYEPPVWIKSEDVPPDEIEDILVPIRTLRDRVLVRLWTSPGRDRDEPLPLLVAHDGPEYDELSDLLKLLRTKTGDGSLPPMRAALIAPVDRDQMYSASAAYARAFSYELIPALERLAPIPYGRRMRVGMGASLGALAMLHIHSNSPATFGGLFLQSGSYFRQRFDKQESGFVRFGRISRFMGRVLTAGDLLHPIPVSMTCGTIEENLANNRATRDALARQGYDVSLHVNRDGHNWVAWRDTFDPRLVSFLARIWAPS